jgi:hypothetical protein
MLDYVAIANLALGHIGEDDRISAPDEQSRVARIIRNAWKGSFLFVLSQANWGFALRTLELTARVADADWPIALERTPFPLPSDLVRLTEIIAPAFLIEDDDAFSIECGPNGQEILVADDGPITIRYVRTGTDIEDPGRWSPSFDQAFQFYLAWQISDPLAADKPRKDRALAAYGAALRDARRANNKLKAPKGNADTPWSRARAIGIERAPGV